SLWRGVCWRDIGTASASGPATGPLINSRHPVFTALAQNSFRSKGRTMTPEELYRWSDEVRARTKHLIAKCESTLDGSEAVHRAHLALVSCLGDSNDDPVAHGKNWSILGGLL